MRMSTLTAVVIALCPFLGGPVQAKGFPYQEGLITTHGSSVFSLAKDGKTQWQATFGASGPLAINPDSNAPWLASGGQLWAFDPVHGKTVWEFKAAGSKKLTIMPASLAQQWIVSWKENDQWNVAALDKSDGRQTWSQSFSAKPDCLGDGDPLILEADQKLVGLSGGKAVWSSDQPHQKSWSNKDRLILQDKLQFICLARSTGEVLWRYDSVPLNLNKDPKIKYPVGTEVALGPELAIQSQDLERHTVTCLDLLTGRPIWQKSAFPSLKTHLSWVGDHLLHRLNENVECLFGLGGGKTDFFVHLNTWTTEGFVWHDQILIMGRSALPENLLDETGKIARDPVTKAPLTELADTFEIFLGTRVLVTGPRSPGQIRFMNGTFVYSTQTKPMPAPRRKDDPVPPDPPLFLRGLLSPQTTPPTPSRIVASEITPANWEWDSQANPDDHPQWDSVGEHLLVFHSDGSLTELAATTGKEMWHSPPLDHSAQLAQVIFEAQGVWVLGPNQVYFLDSSGKIVAHWDLRPSTRGKKTIHLISLLLLMGAIGYYIAVARKKKLFIRKIAGLDAIDEAVGRATEMGRPVLYVPGLEDIDSIQTLASLSILSHVARKTADYDSEILVPTKKAVVMSTAQEVVKEAYSLAGRPDAYSSDNVRYLTDDQFGFVAGVDGIMLREKPAANFYLGTFYGESLILAETGFATGAIQIAGTAEPAQLPFFVATCDYTLMGEELYAASAYLSGDSMQIGSLRGQDVGKAFIMVYIIGGSLLHSLGFTLGALLP